jgi:hypothetical protein
MNASGLAILYRISREMEHRRDHSETQKKVAEIPPLFG